MTVKICFSCLLSALFCILLVSACNRTPEGNAANGGRWYKLYRCNGCHGENGSGGKGPVIADTSLSYYHFLHKLRSPNSPIMPTFDKKQVPDQDAAEIYLWLQQQKKKG
jgi:mono/diheme cytochrome c family protein